MRHLSLLASIILAACGATAGQRSDEAFWAEDRVATLATALHIENRARTWIGRPAFVARLSPDSTWELYSTNAGSWQRAVAPPDSRAFFALTRLIARRGFFDYLLTLPATFDDGGEWGFTYVLPGGCAALRYSEFLEVRAEGVDTAAMRRTLAAIEEAALATIRAATWSPDTAFAAQRDGAPPSAPGLCSPP
jgi:hypothetical protein